MVHGKTYVHHNEFGGLKVGLSDVSLDSVVIGYHEGLSAETIQQHYPSLTLEEVYGAIAFYLANQQEVEGYLRRQDAVWDELRERTNANPSPVVTRLRALAASRAARTS